MLGGGGWGAGLKMSIHEECALATSAGLPAAVFGPTGWKKENPESPPADVALADLASADVETDLAEVDATICCGELQPSGSDAASDVARAEEGAGPTVGSVDDRPAPTSPTPSPADVASMVPVVARLPPPSSAAAAIAAVAIAAAVTPDASDANGAATADDEADDGSGMAEATALGVLVVLMALIGAVPAPV